MTEKDGKSFKSGVCPVMFDSFELCLFDKLLDLKDSPDLESHAILFDFFLTLEDSLDRCIDIYYTYKGITPGKDAFYGIDKIFNIENNPVQFLDHPNWIISENNVINLFHNNLEALMTIFNNRQNEVLKNTKNLIKYIFKCDDQDYINENSDKIYRNIFF
jgi:hypothetical protein